MYAARVPSGETEIRSRLAYDARYASAIGLSRSERLTIHRSPLSPSPRSNTISVSEGHCILSAEGTLLYVESPLSLGSRGQQLAVVDLEGNEETLPFASYRRLRAMNSAGRVASPMPMTTYCFPSAM